MRKILVTGAGGFVGARILDQWRGRYELCTFPHGFSADSDEAAVRALIAREKPDVIVHTAALSNTASVYLIGAERQQLCSGFSSRFCNPFGQQDIRPE